MFYQSRTHQQMIKQLSSFKLQPARVGQGPVTRRFRLPLVTALILGVGAGAVPESWANSVPGMPLSLGVQTAQIPANARVIYVNPVLGSDRPDAGSSEGAPYQSITYALSQATSGTVIQLAPGSYTKDTETFPLTLPAGITLRGDESKKGQNVLIIGGGSFSSPTFAVQNVAIVPARDSTIAGVAVTNPNTRGTGIWIESGAATIRNSTFTSNLREGIFVTGTSTPLIENNVFTENDGNGISIARSAQGEVRGNIFQNTGFGLAIGDSSAPMIVDNRILQNIDGVVVSNSAKPIFRNNVIENNERDGIVIIGDGLPDLGTAESEGKNYIRSNTRYDLYNATRNNTILAVGNDIDASRISGSVEFVATTVAAGFRDIGGHWAQPYIEALAAKGVIAGFNDGTFRPNERVTRAQFAAIVNKAFTVQSNQACSAFADVRSNFWGFEAIQTACRGGFLTGYPGNQFRPEQQIPRVQVLVALASGLGLRSENRQVLSVYSDMSGIPDWAQTAIAGATEKGLVVNYPIRDRLNPSQEATRADVAAFVYQALVNAGQAEAIASPYLVMAP